MGHVFSRLRSTTAGRTDRRLILMDEILSSMRTIKLYAWEKIFVSNVETARAKEVKSLRKTAYCKALNQSLFYVASRITLFITLLAYVLTGNNLNSEIVTTLLFSKFPENIFQNFPKFQVFVSLALYNSVQLVMTLFFPAAIASLAETKVSLRRFQEFLLLPEFEVLDSLQPSKPLDIRITPGPRKDKRRAPLREASLTAKALLDPSIGVTMTNLTAQWNPHSKEMAFSNVSLSVRPAEIVARNLL
jgi:ATP-binding cassette subfamily C (CFTR/MRP) protein 4